VKERERTYSTESVDELLVVGDTEESTSPFTDTDSETSEGVTIQEIGRLIENEALRFRPHGGGDNDLDLLSSRQSSHLVVFGDISIESDIHQMLTNELERHLARTSSFSRSFEVVEFLDEFGESEVDKLLTGHPGVSVHAESSPLDLVRVRLLELLTTDNVLEESSSSVLSSDGSVENRLLLVGEGTSSLQSLLLVDTFLVTPLNVLNGGLLEMLLDVVESVLSDVGDSEVRVLLDLSRVGDGLSGEKLDESRLSSSVGSD
jgi:hypothetical protein